MTKIVFESGDGSQRTLDVPPGTTLMEAAVAEGVRGIVGECGGAAMCATCHVYVDADDLSRFIPMEEDEDELLDCAAAVRREGSRLSCQLLVDASMEGLHVLVPPVQGTL